MQDQGERLDGFATLEADGVHPKKRTLGASERELEFLRAAWRVLVAEALQAGRLVFVDEMGATASVTAVEPLNGSRSARRSLGCPGPLPPRSPAPAPREDPLGCA